MAKNFKTLREKMSPESQGCSRALANKYRAEMPLAGRLNGANTLGLDELRVSQKDTVCKEIQEIMVTYREQEAAGSIDTPGGLEHMGDVWRLLRKWDKLLSE